jgi:DNA mismatch repair protein MSH2
MFLTSKTAEASLRRERGVCDLQVAGKGASVTTAELQALLAKEEKAKEGFAERKRRVIGDLVSRVAGDVGCLVPVAERLSELDVVCALADAAVTFRWVRPRFGDDLVLVEARHAIVEHQIDFIPNDIVMRRGDSTFLIVSGPNSAGKSTLMKTTGLILLLAHMGSFVPCTSAEVPNISGIHARIGASDSPSRSTFQIEMEETAVILEAVSPRSFIMVDELGRSTSSSDGFGLAWAISKRIARESAWCLFATHLHEMRELEGKVPGVLNVHMKAQISGAVVMLYKVAPGAFAKSFGIEAAEKAGFPQNIVEQARSVARELEVSDRADPNWRGRVVIDPNGPYKELLRKGRGVDPTTIAPRELEGIVSSWLASLDAAVAAVAAVAASVGALSPGQGAGAEGQFGACGGGS